MRTAAIVIDTYKLDTFEKRLREAGVAFETTDGITANTLTLKVKAETMNELFEMKGLISQINYEATR